MVFGYAVKWEKRNVARVNSMGWIRTTALLRRQNESNSSYEWGKKPESVEKDLYDLERNFESAFTYDERSGVEVEKKVQQLSTTHPNIMVMNR